MLGHIALISGSSKWNRFTLSKGVQQRRPNKLWVDSAIDRVVFHMAKLIVSTQGFELGKDVEDGQICLLDIVLSLLFVLLGQEFFFVLEVILCLLYIQCLITLVSVL
jgi:hypothetical protein